AELSIKSRLVLWTGSMIVLFLLNAFIIWQLNLASGSNSSGSALPILAELTLLGGAVLAAFGGIAIYKRLVSPLAQAQRDIDRMAAGDLSGRIDANGDNEIAHLMQSLRKLQINIKLLVGQIKEATQQVNQQATSLAHDNGELAGRTESQAANIEETSSAVTEITSIVQQHAENSEAANQLVASTAKAATRGAEAAEQVTRTMAEIQDSAKKIVDIIGVINSIAFQTNILALNAAVEAARAGEQGRGFAVVAAEVRNLALRSADAAKDIKTLIQDSANRVNAGSEQVEQTAQIMQDILGSARHATQIMGEISVAGKEQSLGIAHINQAVSEIEAITQDNAVAVSTTARTAENLQEQAETLSQLINAFKLVNAGSAVHTPTDRARAVASRAFDTTLATDTPPAIAPQPLLGMFKRRTPVARLKMG
ncbi:MAG: methyl-accepting chemotaxis protein, partial [Pusillimonas sp.]